MSGALYLGGVMTGYRYNRSVAALQAKCMFWLLTLKDDLFPERIWNVLFVIRLERGV